VVKFASVALYFKNPWCHVSATTIMSVSKNFAIQPKLKKPAIPLIFNVLQVFGIS